MIADQFRTTFRALEAAFATRFEQLFGGGFARLSLTDPTDLGSTGIEIVARPPGKKAQALAMLSGGERALTAVALLFAMLEVRPVPFCVLDEVDAALDEANIGRFADALRSLAHQTQFIVITHNRGTIEAADALYGVTVGDDSVSRVISLRLDEAQALADRDRGELRAGALMPFWRRNREDRRRTGRAESRGAAPDPERVEPGWEPDPADFEDPVAADGQVAPEPEWEPAAEAAWSIVQPGLVVPEPVYEPEPEPEPVAPDRGRAGLRAEPSIAAPEPVASEPEPGPDHEGSLDAGLERTRGGFMSRLRGFLAGGPEGPSWDDVEETLIAGDVGAALAMDVVERARRRRDPGGAEAAIRAELAALLVPRDLDWAPRPSVAGGPAVVLVVGVNGTGKTTTSASSRAATRARAAASSSPPPTRSAPPPSTSSGSGRTGPAPMVAHAPGADPGAVVYDALDAAVARGADLVIADTAGRLHTKSNLMDELSKIRRIIDKRLPGAEPETIFVLDATTGQNGLAQAEGVPRGGRADRDRPDQARLDGQGRDRLRHRGRARGPGPLRRGGGAGRRPHPVRPGRVRGGALRLDRRRAVALDLVDGPDGRRRPGRSGAA